MFSGADTADYSISEIAALGFKTFGLGSHVIIFNQEALLDIYLPLT